MWSPHGMKPTPIMVGDSRYIRNARLCQKPSRDKIVIMTDEFKNSFSDIILEAMRAKGVSLDYLSQTTGISDRFLSLLIEKRVEELPPSPYLHGYIIKISKALGLDGEQVWIKHFKDADFVRKTGTSNTLPGNMFLRRRLNKKIVAFSVLGIIVAVYVFVRLYSYFGTPELSLSGVEDNMVVKEENFTLKGKTPPTNDLILNGEQIYLSSDGSFEKEIKLSPGFNTLKFNVKKFLGKEYTIEKRIFFEVATSAPAIVPEFETSGELSGGGL
ncbi:MAG: hypothetical protein UX22_C0007G0006 [Candidatus Jorgensenbacteria bacterium GW2011_GWA2_45_9]|uniref:HTH cro/C1-type domain-containing protein n=2 Tax=Candidatus Joergenseniibacteriota TaxID=1752739 RepID=A0A0G1QCR8_9BACT|nr:MAG: hypothetical protein UX22_C0007G0006 [Candidatus Jorgensenbacteria bacterium GW2011_GWA2_45_9]